MVQGRFCHVCGQENVVPHETFWHMVTHFVYDITHFDTKFFESLKFLLFRPGFLPGEYVKGRRASYLNPVKKYVFTSALFFLLFFGFFAKSNAVRINIDEPISAAERSKRILMAEAELAKAPGNAEWAEALKLLRDSSRVVSEADLGKYWGGFDFISVSDRKYRDRSEYDSIQASLPESEKDGWLTRQIEHRNLALKKKYGSDPRSGSDKLVEAFLHLLPYLLFVSLPLFALALKLLYLRRKEYYYADHGIFSIYHYIFSFLLLLAVLFFQKLTDLTGFEGFRWISVILFISGGVYLYIAMRRFYSQGAGKTFLKFILLNIAGIITLIVLFFLFVMLAVFEI